MTEAASRISPLSKDMRDILEIFNRRQVEYLVVGAHAVSTYAEPRATKDLDLLINNTAENAERVFGALQEFGAPLSGMTPQEFQDEENFFVIGIKPNRSDILMQIPGLKFEEAWTRRKVLSVDGIALAVPHVEDLLAAKLAAGRPQDLVDAAKLKTAMQRKLP